MESLGEKLGNTEKPYQTRLGQARHLPTVDELIEKSKSSPKPWARPVSFDAPATNDDES